MIDAEGNAVALTTTVNFTFGSCIVPPGTGIVLNDQMDDFAIAPGVPNAYGVMGGEANAVAPGKVPLSSMAPTLVFGADGKVMMAVGAPGGSTIPTTVAQVIAHVVDDGMAIDKALGAPRIHQQLHPEATMAEPDALEAATAAALRARGHTFLPASKIGNAQAVVVDPNTGWRVGASDPRFEGAASIP